MKKLLIVEDLEDYVKKYSDLAEGKLDVIVATNMEEAIHRLQEKPDYILTDHDFPGGNGNWLAREAKRSIRNVVVVGQSGGGAEIFGDHVDIKLSKSESTTVYSNLMDILSSSSNPVEEFQQIDSQAVNYMDLGWSISALNILVQGIEVLRENLDDPEKYPFVKSEDPIGIVRDICSAGEGVESIVHQYEMTADSVKELVQQGTTPEIGARALEYLTNMTLLRFIEQARQEKYEDILETRSYDAYLSISKELAASLFK